MIRQLSSESNKRPSRRNSQHDCDSEVSFDELAEHVSRPSNLSSYAEYTESDGEAISDEIEGENKENFKNEVNFKRLG